MKPHVSPSLHLWHRLFLLLTALAFIGTSGPLAAASGGRKILDLELSADRLTAKVTVPAGVESVTVQRFQRDGGWQKIRTKSAVAGVMKFKLPAAGAKVRWRAIGQFAAKAVPHDKFPAAFYQGKSRFDAIKKGGRIRTPGILLKELTTTGGGDLAPYQRSGGSGHLEDRWQHRLFLQSTARLAGARYDRSRRSAAHCFATAAGGGAGSLFAAGFRNGPDGRPADRRLVNPRWLMDADQSGQGERWQG